MADKADKFSISDLLKFLPQLLKWGPYLGVVLTLFAVIRTDLADDGDTAEKKAADVVIDVIDAAGPVLIQNNPKNAATLTTLLALIRKAASDFAAASAPGRSPLA